VNGQPDSGGSVRSHVRFLREHWLVIVMMTIAAGALGFAISSQQRPKYRTSLQILFRETTIGQQVAGVPIFENPQANSTAGSEMTTNVTLLGSETVARSVIRQLDLDTDVQSLLERVSVRQVGLSNIGEITVTADQAREAQRIADAWGEAFIGQRRQADQTKLGDAIGLLKARLEGTPQADLASDVARQTSEQLQRLELLKSVQDGNAEVVVPAGLPDAPYSPRTKRAAVIAALLGALLGVGLAALRRALDRRVKDPDDVGAILGIPVLAEISVAAFGDVEAFVSAEGPKGDVWRSTEEFRTLATNLRYIGDAQNRRTIAVMSAVPDEGKTTIASNLAITLARMGRGTALIDSDLRRGRIHTLFGVDPNAGLSTVATGLSEARHTWVRVPLEPATSELAVMPAGPPPSDPVQILESATVSHLVREARESYDCVLLDTPPVLVVSDALAISRRVDAVLVVVRLGRTTRDQIKRLSAALDRVGVRPIGVAVTGVKRKTAYYSSAYQYGAGVQPGGVEVGSWPPA
jgi:succinoglycan biosynthesis transport protein ExoP